MKRKGFIYNDICSYENIELALLNASKGKRHQYIVKRALHNRKKCIESIQSMLVNKTYTPSPYQIIELFDGATKKKRTISKPRFYPDQIIHWALMLQIEPIIMKGMYLYNCGSIPGRGTSYGQKIIEKWMRNDPKCTKYCLKMDISKYYPSISNEIMKAKFRKKIKDSDCLWLIDQIIDSAQGLPIGNFTSQWFANFFLVDFDHFVKKQSGAHYYIRYVDDLVVFGSNKRKLHAIRKSVDVYLRSMDLKVKGNWQVFPIKSRSLDFLGLRFHRSHTTLRRKNSLRIRRRLKKISKKDKPSYQDACAIVSYWGWIKRSNSFKLYNDKIKCTVSIRKAKQVISEYGKANSIPIDTRVQPRDALCY